MIDTGFTGSLTLPPALTALLGLPLDSYEAVTLADGGRVLLPVCRAILIWAVRAIETRGGPLVGMALLEGSRLTVEVLDDGPVTIGPIP